MPVDAERAVGELQRGGALMALEFRDGEAAHHVAHDLVVHAGHDQSFGVRPVFQQFGQDAVQHGVGGIILIYFLFYYILTTTRLQVSTPSPVNMDMELSLAQMSIVFLCLIKTHTSLL